MNSSSPKLGAYNSPKTRKLEALSCQILSLETELESHIPSTLWISDLHGEGDRFRNILKGRFGMLYQTCVEALPQEKPETIRYLGKIIRQARYSANPEMPYTLKEVALFLVQVLRYKMTHVQYPVTEIIQPEYRDYILRLISQHSVPHSLLHEPAITERLITHLSNAVKAVLLDRIVVLGDIFDRGPQPDKIIRILASTAYRRIVTFVFGNHDILWMGAAVGCRSLIAEATRVTCRYDHFDLLRRLGFDFSKLEAFATRVYPAKRCTGNFKAKTAKGRSMEKALAVIQFKLEDHLIRENPQFGMESRLLLPQLAQTLKSGATEGLNDTFFPTLDLQDPARLNAEEAAVMDDLEQQFVHNDRLKRLLRFFFEKGETYHVHNNLLNIHALVPSTKEGEFEEFMGYRGKALLDFIQTSIRRSGEAYLKQERPRAADRALYFYLWCGPKSPFFGKEAMKTYERYFNLDKETHKEPSLYWKSNLETLEFKQRLLQEFAAKRVIFGHTPVDVTKGKKMASDDGMAINVDGGFAAAYYNRGHALVHTPHQLYGIILPTPDEIQQADKTKAVIPLSVELIDEFKEPMKVKQTYQGKKLKAQLADLKVQLAALVKEP